MFTTRHSVPGTSAGFDYQFDRALYWLVQSPAGAVIGIETDDDVAVHSSDGSLREQDKYSTREGGQPFGDRSKNLWNTLAIWLDAIEATQVKIETTRFLMVTNKALPECILKQIGRVESKSDSAECIKALEKASEEPPQGISHLVERVLRSESRSTLLALLVKVESVDASDATGGAELRQKSIGHLQLPDWCLSSAESILVISA